MRFITFYRRNFEHAQYRITITVPILKKCARNFVRQFANFMMFTYFSINKKSTFSFPLKYAITVKPGGGYMALYMDNKQTCNLAFRRIGIEFTVTASYPGNFHTILSRRVH